MTGGRAARVRLTKRTVDAATCPPGRKDTLVFDADLKGFGLRVTAQGAKVFLFQYRAGATVRRALPDNPPMTRRPSTPCDARGARRSAHRVVR